MARYALLVFTVLGSAATAIAAIQPSPSAGPAHHNVTVIEKNDPFPVIGPLVFTPCATEDCSE